VALQFELVVDWWRWAPTLCLCHPHQSLLASEDERDGATLTLTLTLNSFFLPMEVINERCVLEMSSEDERVEVDCGGGEGD
jgi:hypothetical protein